MDQETQKKSSQQTVEAIFALDLELIKQNLMDKSAGHGWTRRQADHNELEYKRFLVLLAKYPEQAIAPSTEVNKFWRAHILDTMKYAKDCDAVFGYFLHHCPYFGTQGEQDAANLVSAFMNMQRLYDREFGDAKQVANYDEAALLIAPSTEEAGATIENSACFYSSMPDQESDSLYQISPSRIILFPTRRACSMASS